MSTTLQGKIKWYNGKKGYGFIEPESGDKDVFVHITALRRSSLPPLEEGTRLIFETEPDKRGRGPQAVNLALAGDE